MRYNHNIGDFVYIVGQESPNSSYSIIGGEITKIEKEEGYVTVKNEDGKSYRRHKDFIFLDKWLAHRYAEKLNRNIDK